MSATARHLLLACVGLAACRFDPTIPGAATFTCDSDADCPPDQGLRCQTGRHVCVAEGLLDTVAPGLSDATLKLFGPDLDEPVTRLGLDGRAEISLVTSEAVEAPVLTSEPALDCGVVRSAAPNSFVFGCRVRPSNPAFTGPAQVSVQLTDLAGNRATAMLTALALTLDTEPPAAPDVQTDERIVYRRVPWGAERTQGQVQFDVSGGPSAVEPGARVLVRVGSETLGRATANADGSFGPVALGVDASQLALLAVDAAGNRSPQVGVRDVMWVATLGGKNVPGRQNPHEAKTYLVHGPALLRVDGAELGGTECGRADGTLGVGRSGWTWELVERDVPSNDPGITELAAATYDLARARELGFGVWHYLAGAGWGVPDSITTNDETRSWNHLAVRRVVTADPEGDGDPSPRVSSAMVYDEERRSAVLFGGGRAPTSTPSDDTWVWNGVSWRSVSPARSPPPRYGHALAYDAARGRTVLVGGVGTLDAGALHDTWEFDGFTWERIDAGVAPSLGISAYDRARGTVVLAEPGGALWEYTGQWHPLDAGSPPTRVRAMAYDARRDRLVAIGARGGPTVTLEWNGADWTTGPAPAVEPDALYFDPTLGTVMGQATGSKDPSSWDGGQWTRLPQVAPASLKVAGAAMAYSPTEDAIVRFGGLSNGTPVATTALWRGRWQTVAGVSPPGGVRWALAWDPFSTRMVLGGDDFWEFSSDAGWRHPSGAPVNTDGGTLAGVSLQTTGDGVVAAAAASHFGTANDALFLRGPDAGWTRLGPHPGAAQVSRASSLPDGGLLLLTDAMVGTTGFSEWRGWELAGPTFAAGAGSEVSVPAPLGPEPNTFMFFFPDLSSATMHLDSSRGRVVALGLPPGNTVWQYSARSWSLGAVSDPESDGQPRLTYAVSAAHHPGLKRTVVVDDGDGQSWLLRSADTRPSIVVRFATAAAGFAPTATWRRVELNVVAGAATDASRGARVQLWENGAWLDVAGATNTSDPASPASVELVESNPLRLRNLLSHQPDLALAVVPLTDTGRADAVVSLDYVEAVIHYRLP